MTPVLGRRAALVLALVATALGLAAPAGAAQRGFVPAPPMHDGRVGHQATTLLSDDVLVTGGDTDAGATASAELYDSPRSSWSPAASMVRARARHTATRLLDGAVLVAGGADAVGPMADAETYDESTDAWSGTDPMGTPREDHRATRLDDGRVLVTGGHDASGALASAELYEPDTRTWSPTAPMGAAREDHQATLLADGRVLVTGGHDGATVRSSAELYDPSSGTWSPAASMGRRRDAHQATALADGRVLVTGGDDGTAPTATTEIYDRFADQWTTGPVLPWAMRDHRALLQPGSSSVLIAGGFDGSAEVDGAVILDASLSWMQTLAGELRVGRRGLELATFNGDDAVAIGGASGTDRLASTLRLSLLTRRSSPAPDFGDVTVGRRSGVSWVPVRNTGTEDLVVSATTITGPDAGDFSVTGDGCVGEHVLPHDTCLVGVRFAPTGAGSRTARLHFDDNTRVTGIFAVGDPWDVGADVPLAGAGVAVAAGSGPPPALVVPSTPDAGPAGPAGSAGPAGAAGAAGTTGSAGSAGTAGRDGTPGAAGSRGPAGARGGRGLPGPRGTVGLRGRRGRRAPLAVYVCQRRRGHGRYPIACFVRVVGARGRRVVSVVVGTGGHRVAVGTGVLRGRGDRDVPVRAVGVPSAGRYRVRVTIREAGRPSVTLTGDFRL